MSKPEARQSRWPLALAILIALVGAALSTSLALAALPQENLVRPEQARPAASSPDCDPNWLVVASPNVGPGRNVLQGVAAVSSSDVWAVGSSEADTNAPLHTLVEHWNGSAWSVVSSPNRGPDNNNLTGVAALSANDVWAVGSDGKTLVEHWNGSAWSIVPS